MSPHWIEIDDEVMALLGAEAEPLVDSPNRALRRLLGLPAPDSRGEAPTAVLAAPARRPRAPSGSLLRSSEYELPILGALAERGGWAARREVLAALGEALADRLTELDRETLQSGGVRWEARVNHVRLHLIQRGWLKAGSPRGVWELAEAGARELAERSRVTDRGGAEGEADRRGARPRGRGLSVASGGEVAVYVPAAGHPAVADIAPRSAIVGEPHGEEVAIHYEGALYGQVGMGSLADRASHAHGRMRADYPTRATRVVPREALIAVGSFDPRSGRIVLTGPDSEREVAAWLGEEWLDPAELLCRGLGDE